MLYRYVSSNNTYIKLANKIVLSFAIAGVLSNLIDRIWNGQVVDYLHIANFTSLNLGYIYLLVTWIGLAILLTKHTAERIKEKKIDDAIKKEKEENEKEKKGKK